MSGGKEDWAARARAVIGAQSNNFMELLKISGLDPKTDLRFADWSGVDFSGCDLRGFDFTGARLHGCNFGGAFIEGARLDQAEINGSDVQAANDWVAYVRSWRKAKELPSDGHLPTCAVFRDAPFAPEMVVIPPGRFWMGSRLNEGHEEERPRHEVTIPRSIAIGRYPVTFEEWDFAQADTEWTTITKMAPREPGRGYSWEPEPERGRRPVPAVSWEEARAYTEWLSHKTREPYRLLSEAEWEYACRAGSEAAYCFGDNEGDLGNYAWHRVNSESSAQLLVGQKMPNKFGVYDMHGSVWEWCEDVWHKSYKGKHEEQEGGDSAWTTGDKSMRVLRGGSFRHLPEDLRSANRYWDFASRRGDIYGFRLARILTI
jgi:formylglycine-generating enzyme required for sulfatase activity